MKGNIYISIPEADIDNSLPAGITRYDWNEYTYTEEGEVETTTTVHPTWKQYGDKYSKDFGAPVTVVVDSQSYTVYEMIASWKESEVSSLLILGSGKSEPNYTVMTAEEARKFIAENSSTDI
jgi:hypothetical protein